MGNVNPSCTKGGEEVGMTSTQRFFVLRMFESIAKEHIKNLMHNKLELSPLFFWYEKLIFTTHFAVPIIILHS